MLIVEECRGFEFLIQACYGMTKWANINVHKKVFAEWS
jgi:hypothetical protein